jgi:dTDP-4-amino-4,6-dideoxygalactose transaminase
MINVTKSYLPDLDEYVEYLKGIWERTHLTNDGPLAKKLETQLKEKLGIAQLFFCNNGTIPLQIALKILKIEGREVITTPFSYVATTNAILWENAQPVFVDIDPLTLCIDTTKIEAAITPNTAAIMATHVYGNACDVEAIEALSKKYNIPVIYDGAHAFAATYKGQSLLSYGDLVTCSFHATKLFHTAEGGAIMTNKTDWTQEMRFMRAFGHSGDEYFFAGINGKNSELHAAMGLCVLPKVDELVAARKAVCDLYDAHLNWSKIAQPTWVSGLTRNYSYYPIIVESEERLLTVFEALKAKSITPRRYFYPSLNTLHFLQSTQSCPVSEDIAKRVLCLPLYPSLAHDDVLQIINITNHNL